MGSFTEITAGTLPAGTTTPFGVIAAATLTAYRMTTGEFVPFAKVHGRATVADILCPELFDWSVA